MADYYSDDAKYFTKKKRSDGRERRNVNFHPSEEVLLLTLVLNRKHIVECKATDTKTNEAKDKAWDEIASVFNSTGPEVERQKKTLQLKYKNVKRFIKEVVLSHGKLKFKYPIHQELYDALKSNDDFPNQTSSISGVDNDAECSKALTAQVAKNLGQQSSFQSKFKEQVKIEKEGPSPVNDRKRSFNDVNPNGTMGGVETDDEESNDYCSNIVWPKPKPKPIQSWPKRKKLFQSAVNEAFSPSHIRELQLEKLRNEIAMASETHDLMIAERKQKMRNDQEEHDMRMRILHADLEKNCHCGGKRKRNSIEVLSESVEILDQGETTYCDPLN